MFDQIPLVDPKAVRAKYGIPDGKKVVVFFAPFLNVGDYWREIVASATSVRSRLRRAVRARRLRYIPSLLLGDNIADVVAAIRRFCDRENAILIVKSRGKQAGLETAAAAADIFVSGEDDEYYPTFTGYELIATADLCIQTQSFSAVEAVIAGKPSLCIAIPRDMQTEQVEWRQRTGAVIMMHDAAEGLFNYPGCVYSVKWHRVVKYLDRASLADYSTDSGRRADYVSKFLGMARETSSARVLRAIHDVSAAVSSTRRAD